MKKTQADERAFKNGRKDRRHTPPWRLRQLFRRIHWHIWRLGYAFDSLVLNYHRPRITAWLYRTWPRGYSHECPPWAMRGSKIPWLKPGDSRAILLRPA